MALSIGDKEATSGLSEKLYNDMLSILEEINAFTYVNPDGETQDWADENIDQFKERLKKTSYGTAKGVVQYIQDNADVQVNSNISIDPTFWAWLTGFIAIFQSWISVPYDGGSALNVAMKAYLETHPVPSSLLSKGIGSNVTEDGVN